MSQLSCKKLCLLFLLANYTISTSYTVEQPRHTLPPSFYSKKQQSSWKKMIVARKVIPTTIAAIILFSMYQAWPGKKPKPEKPPENWLDTLKERLEEKESDDYSPSVLCKKLSELLSIEASKTKPGTTHRLTHDTPDTKAQHIIGILYQEPLELSVEKIDNLCLVLEKVEHPEDLGNLATKIKEKNDALEGVTNNAQRKQDIEFYSSAFKDWKKQQEKEKLPAMKENVKQSLEKDPDRYQYLSTFKNLQTVYDNDTSSYEDLKSALDAYRKEKSVFDKAIEFFNDLENNENHKEAFEKLKKGYEATENRFVYLRDTVIEKIEEIMQEIINSIQEKDFYYFHYIDYYGKRTTQYFDNLSQTSGLINVLEKKHKTRISHLIRNVWNDLSVKIKKD